MCVCAWQQVLASAAEAAAEFQRSQTLPEARSSSLSCRMPQADARMSPSFPPENHSGDGRTQRDQGARGDGGEGKLDQSGSEGKFEQRGSVLSGAGGAGAGAGAAGRGGGGGEEKGGEAGGAGGGAFKPVHGGGVAEQGSAQPERADADAGAGSGAYIHVYL